jgi:hypothetical protein
VLDVHEMENGMETTKREHEASSGDSASSSAAGTLSGFLNSAAERITKLKQDCMQSGTGLVS